MDVVPLGAPTATVHLTDRPGGERKVMHPDLYKAATSGDTASLLRLLQCPMRSGFHACGLCRFSEVTAEKDTVLHLAAGLGHTELAAEACRIERSLLKEENSRGDTPLHCAARAGRSCVVSLLLRLAGHGASEVLMKNGLGDTALHDAVRNEHGEVAGILMSKAPNLASIDNNAGVSPLYLAVMSGSIPLVESLIRTCDHASFAGPNGQTALHAAVLSNKKIASILLEWKPTILAQQVDASGSTPLHYAVSVSDTEMVQMLLKASTSATYSRDNDGFTPIHVAARLGYVSTIKLLLKTCPDSAGLLDSNRRNFLHLAAEKRNNKVVEYVLKHGKELEKLINEQDFEGNTPLHLAVKSGNSPLVLALTKDERIRKSIMNNEGQTPLELASEITRLLPMASIVLGLIFSGASFSVRRQDHVKPLRVGSTWIFKVSKTLTIVSALIATVAFSATFNLPGGYSSDGKATLHGQRSFTTFMSLDSMAMILSLASTIQLILVSTAYSPNLIVIFINGILTLWESLLCMAIAFFVAAFSAGFQRALCAAFFLSVTPCAILLFDRQMRNLIKAPIRGLLCPSRPTSRTLSRAIKQYGVVFVFILVIGLIIFVSLVSGTVFVVFLLW